VAPVHRRQKGSLAGQGTPAAPREQQETIVEAGGDLGRGEHPDPHRRKLYGERNAVEPLADARHGGSVVLVEFEARCRGLGPLREQTDRLMAHQLAGSSLFPRVGKREGGNEPGPLTRDAQGLPAGREYLELGARAEKVVRQPRARLDEVLAVVQNQERLSGLQVVQQGLGRRKPAPAQAKRPCRALGHELGTREGGQLDETDAVLEVFRQVGRSLQRKPGLAATSGTGERQQPARRQHALQVVQLTLAPDKTAGLRRQVDPQASTGLLFL
jgi:hypothetical protein